MKIALICFNAEIAACGLCAVPLCTHAQSTDTPHGAAGNDMVLVAGGTFEMGSNAAHEDETPVHTVTLKPFLLDRHEVTNRQFTAFVDATGFVTSAERDGAAWCYLKGESDFRYVNGANWRHPEGPDSSISDRLGHPVVCVSWDDAHAYAEWAGKRLPTEAEWEYAARSRGAQHVAANPNAPSTEFAHEDRTHKDHAQHEFSESSSGHPSSRSHELPDLHAAHSSHQSDAYVTANIWQGVWPAENKLSDGFFGTAPVGSFEPNKINVYDMIGNVWEWTADWYDATYYATSPTENPTGPLKSTTRVARGGSWFCSANYCGAYNSHYRGSSPPDHAFNNVGFRCAADLPLPVPNEPGVSSERQR